MSLVKDTAVSRKVVGKSARDNPERYCGWFLVHCFSNKFQRMAREVMDVCLRGLKESNKSRFGIVARTVFATTFLEIAVYSTEAPNATTELFHLSQECLMGILVVSKVFGGFSSHLKLLATMLGRLVEK